MVAPNGPTDGELLKLVARLELDEKISLLAGRNFWETVPIDRLKVPSLKVRNSRGKVYK
jgi:beta-glucosidase